MAQVDVQTAAGELEDLLLRAARGEEIVIARAGLPVARLVPFARVPPRRFGVMHLDVPDDFDAPFTDGEEDVPDATTPPAV